MPLLPVYINDINISFTASSVEGVNLYQLKYFNQDFLSRNQDLSRYAFGLVTEGSSPQRRAQIHMEKSK